MALSCSVAARHSRRPARSERWAAGAEAGPGVLKAAQGGVPPDARGEAPATRPAPGDAPAIDLDVGAARPRGGDDRPAEDEEIAHATSSIRTRCAPSPSAPPPTPRPRAPPPP